MKKESIYKKILSLSLIIFLTICFLINNSFGELSILSNYISERSINPSENNIADIEESYADHLWIKNKLININGYLSKALNLKDYFADRGVHITNDKYAVGIYPYTSTDYEYEQTVALYNVLKEHGINLLYINEPTKYINDSYTEEEFGLRSYTNENADLFLSRIREEGIPVIDLREELITDNLNTKDMFYRTDHHWTAPAGFWASQKIVEGLNDYCGYNIDLSIYDENNYTFTQYNNCWVGEQGKLVGESYVGRDNYTLIEPNFDTSYTMTTEDGVSEESFNRFINYVVFREDNVDKISWHYAYRQYNTINHNVDYGKVLMLTDSYGNVTVPFVSLGIHELNSLIRRDYDTGYDLINYILSNNYDTVIISYAQFMIGAHDSSDSANYKMFMFIP